MKHLVIVLLLTLVLSGCFGGGQGSDDAPSQDPKPVGGFLHEVSELLPFETTAEDGTALRGHVYLPNGTGPFATVLELSGYWNTAYGKGHSEDQEIERDGRRTLQGRLGPLVEAEFAVALVNPRGTGESDGCFDWRGPTDAADAGVIVEALADEPWSNGAVGMFGLSYPGAMQYLAIEAAPPSLKAVVPVSGIIDEWSLFTYNGAVTLGGSQSYPDTLAKLPTGASMLQRGEVGDTDPSHLTCPGYGPGLVSHGELVWNGDRDEYWEARDRRGAIAETDVPLLVANGLTNTEGHILQFEGLWDLIPHEQKRFLLGQWPHAYPFGDEVGFTRDYAVPWFDHYLRGGPKLVETGVVEYQDSGGTWHVTDRWPPEGDEIRLRLSGEAIIDEGSSPESVSMSFGSSDWVHAPDDCPTFKATFVSPPLAEDVLFAGNFLVNVTLTSTLPDGNFAVTLWHVEDMLPCDKRIAQAAQDEEALERLEVARAHSDLRHRGHLDVGRDFPVDAPDVMRMTSEPFAVPVPAGERLVLTVAGGDWELFPKPHKPVLTVHTGPDVETELVLNVVEGVLRFTDQGNGKTSVGSISTPFDWNPLKT